MISHDAWPEAVYLSMSSLYYLIIWARLIYENAHLLIARNLSFFFRSWRQRQARSQRESCMQGSRR